ncbi:MAG TPA: site-specific integrase, partial [Methylotenera sp.]|nr:site-specific integrase [Methylotenera sp.]
MDDYLQHLTYERGLSALTCKSYARDIALLDKLAANADLKLIKNQQVRRFIAVMHSQ